MARSLSKMVCYGVGAALVGSTVTAAVVLGLAV